MASTISTTLLRLLATPAMLFYKKTIRVLLPLVLFSALSANQALFAQTTGPSPSPSASATPTATPEASVSPTLEQRVAGLEAYLNNGDPTAPLKDKQGSIPKDLTTPSIGTSGPGHNAWMMTSSALVLFMTLPG